MCPLGFAVYITLALAMTPLRYILASLLAPFTALALPVLLALCEMNAEPLPLADSSYDDASQRGAGLFLLMVAPISYILVASFYAGAAHVLARLGRFSRKSFLWVAALIPWTLVVLGVVGLVANNNSYLSGLLMLLAIGIAMSFLALGGALTWLYVAVPKMPANQSFHQTASGGR